MYKVLVIEDDRGVQDVIRIALEYEGMEVEVAESGEEALERLGPSHPFAVLILDVMLPGVDGISLCREVRARDGVPIIMVTARDDEKSIIVGLEVGADDYVTKPFSTAQLVSRIRSNIRRQRLNSQALEQKLLFPNLVIDVVERQVQVQGAPVRLTSTEFDILRLLATNPGRIFSREQIMREVSGTDFFGGMRTIDMHVGHIRKKIEANPKNPLYIHTERGAGYKFNRRSLEQYQEGD